jgi:hypothetical protein
MRCKRSQWFPSLLLTGIGLCCRSSPPANPATLLKPTLLVTSPDLSKLYGANEAKMPQSVVFEAQGEEFV